MKTLKIVTYNTWNCQGRLQDRLALMTSGLRELDPDIVLLQEVFAEVPSGLNVADHLADELDLQAAFVPARKKLREFQSNPVLCHSGLAVLTRGDILDNAKLNLPQDERDGERLAQFVSLRIDGVTVLIANTHLTHLGDAGDLRAQELDVLSAHLNDCPGHDVVVVGGDMNADETDAIFDVLDGFTSYPIASSPTTLNPVNGKAPKLGLIDHLFVSAKDVAIKGQAGLSMDGKDETAGVFPSDHKAVVLDLSIDLS